MTFILHLMYDSLVHPVLFPACNERLVLRRTHPYRFFSSEGPNIMRGVPIDESMTFVGNLLTLLNPFALLAGFASLALFTLHGAIFLNLKAGGPSRKGWIPILACGCGAQHWRPWDKRFHLRAHFPFCSWRPSSISSCRCLGYASTQAQPVFSTFSNRSRASLPYHRSNPGNS